MDNSSGSTPDLLSADQLEVDEQSGSYLKDAAIWAKAIAIISTIICGLLIVALGALSKFFFGPYAYRGGAYVTGMVAAVLILAGVAAIFIINLFRFSSGMASGIANQDMGEFEKGISGLKNYFIFMGIGTLLLTFFYIIRLIS